MLWHLNCGFGWHLFPSAFLPPSKLPPPLVLGVIHRSISFSAGIDCALRVLTELEISARMPPLNYSQKRSSQALWWLMFVDQYLLSLWANLRGMFHLQLGDGLAKEDLNKKLDEVTGCDRPQWFGALTFAFGILWLRPWLAEALAQGIRSLRQGYCGVWKCCYCAWHTSTIFKSC